MDSQLIPGVIGGMGPEATIDLLYRVIKYTPAQDDNDHIRILIDNNPSVPSRIKAIIEKTGESPAPTMIKMAQGLIAQGADFLVIPCNTAHYYYDAVVSAVTVPVINIVEITAKEIANKNFSKVGLLGSTALQITEIYHSVLQRYDIEASYPDKEYQAVLMEMIKAIKAKSFNNHHLEEFNKIQNHMKDRKVDCLVLACTELSVIRDQVQFHMPVFDTLDILAQEIIRQSKKNSK